LRFWLLLVNLLPFNWKGKLALMISTVWANLLQCTLLLKFQNLMMRLFKSKVKKMTQKPSKLKPKQQSISKKRRMLKKLRKRPSGKENTTSLMASSTKMMVLLEN